MISVIRDAWSWIGLDAVEIVATNAFGNYLVRDADGAYWRICPEELSCAKIADDESAYVSLLRDNGFLADWELQHLLELAVKKFGSPTADTCFCLKMPGVFGGKYVLENIGTISRRELVSFAGDMARQIEGVPDGAKLELKIIRDGG
jgi:hypothetical protein